MWEVVTWPDGRIVAIPFARVRMIEAEGARSLLTLTDGTEVHLIWSRWDAVKAWQLCKEAWRKPTLD